VAEEEAPYMSPEDIAEMIKGFTGQMKDAAARLDFEKAAMLRDEIRKLEKRELETSSF
jgi:excinuclease UvrABC helicase subunit UvrB